MRVTDDHHRALLAGQREGGGELPGDRCRAGIVIQKDVPRQTRQADALCGSGGQGSGVGAAVQKEQVALLQRGHQHRHGLLLVGHLAAHVIVQSAGVRDDGQRVVKSAAQFVLGQLGTPCVGAARRRHRKVQYDCLAGRMGALRKLGGVAGVRQYREGDRAGQRQNARVSGRILPEVVDDQRQLGCAGLADSRSGPFAVVARGQRCVAEQRDQARQQQE